MVELIKWWNNSNVRLILRNGLRCLFGITLWKIKSALPPGTNQFSWHPNLFGLAIILYTEAYWVKRSFNPYYLRSLFGLGWTGRNRLHVLLSALASYSSYYGLYSIWVTKNINNKPHFTSWHGQVGLAAMIAIVYMYLSGIVSFHRPNYKFPKSTHKKLATFAIGSYLLAYILGLYSNWANDNIQYNDIIRSIFGFALVGY
jgi:cytochrome b-561 domain-containing protein 2